MPSYYPTKHAVSAMAARGITWQQVLKILESPEVTYQNGTGPHAGKNTAVHQRGNLYAVVGLEARYDRHDDEHLQPMYPVVTVGLRAQHRWTNEDVRNRDMKES